MNIRLDGKRALVTGANSGIGEAIALALGESGAKVAVNYLVNPGAANTVVEKIKKNSTDALAVEADISKADAVAAMFKKIDQTWGGVDILINNAGIDGGRALGWEIDPDAWKRVLEINLFGAFHCSREALKRMVPQKNGVILNISSVHELIPWSGYSAYTASKAGIGMMAQTLAMEAAPHNVRVLSLGPGAIKTPINRSVWSDPEGLKDLLEKIPMNRMGDADEIGRMAVVLVSDVASYITGRTIFVDGGMTEYPSFTHGG